MAGGQEDVGGLGGCRGARGVLADPPHPDQDLREECIKLKKRVFELERQNQVLSDLFQQKLQLSTGSLPQVCPGLHRSWGVGMGQSPLRA